MDKPTVEFQDVAAIQETDMALLCGIHGDGCNSEGYEMRWAKLMRTTNSGKTLFVCKICGRESTGPDKECPKFPVVLGGVRTEYRCHEVEDRMEQEVLNADERSKVWGGGS